MRYRPAAALAVLATNFVFAAGARAAAPVDVAPLLTDRTIAVARLDLSRVKLRPASDWFLGLMKTAGATPEILAQANQGGSAVALLGQPMIDGLRRLKIDEIAVVLQAHDTPGQMPIALIAFDKPADPAAAVRVLSPLNMRSGQLGGLQVFSPNLPPGTLAKMKPVARPDLTDPVAEPAGHAAIASFVPHESMNTGAGEALGEKLKAVTLTFDTDAGPHLLARLTTASPEMAEQFKKKLADVRRATSRPMPEAERIGVSFFETLPMTVDDADVVIDMRQPDFETAAKTAIKAAQNAVQDLRPNTGSQSNQRTLLQGVMIYANEHKGATPAVLADLVPYVGQGGVIPPALLTNPARPELGTNGYVFVPAPEGKLHKIKNVAGRLAIYEAGEFGEGVNVGFWDGHVEFVRDNNRFDALLAAAKTPAAPVAPATQPTP